MFDHTRAPSSWLIYAKAMPSLIVVKILICKDINSMLGRCDTGCLWYVGKLCRMDVFCVNGALSGAGHSVRVVFLGEFA
jgi:hypothetical protein